jgi:hypothetical protein
MITKHIILDCHHFDIETPSFLPVKKFKAVLPLRNIMATVFWHHELGLLEDIFGCSDSGS